MTFQEYFIVFINFASFVGIIAYFLFKKNKYRGTGNSVLNKLIEKKYRKWFIDNNGTIEDTRFSVYEFNKLLYQLKEELEKIGVRKEHVSDYIVYLESNTNRTSFIKRLFLWLFSIVNLKEVLFSIGGYINSKNSTEESTLNISGIINGFVDFLLIISVIGILVGVIYIAFTMEIANLKKLRIGILKELEVVWDYEVIDTPPSNLENLRSDVVYKNYNREETLMENIIGGSVGESLEKNLSLLLNISDEFKNKLLLGLKSFVGNGLSFILGFVFLISYWFVFNTWKINIIITIIMLVLLSVFYVFYLLLLNSQFIDNIDEARGRISTKINRLVCYNGKSWRRLLVHIILYIFGIFLLNQLKFEIVCSPSFWILLGIHAFISIVSTLFYLGKITK